VQQVLVEVGLVAGVLLHGLVLAVVGVVASAALEQFAEADKEGEGEAHAEEERREVEDGQLAELLLDHAGQERSEEAAEASEQVDDARGVAESLQAYQVAQVHCRERVHASYSINKSHI
jgi:hypothetical protein